METFGTLYCDEDVLAHMPPATGEKVELFTIGKYVTRKELEAEYESRGLVPASPYDLAALHEKDEKLADKKGYTATIFDHNGPCFAVFNRWGGVRLVSVDRNVNDCRDNWWFAGLRKSDLSTKTTKHSSGSLELRVQEIEEIIKHHNLGL
jgi:hypothetical protein